MADRITRDQAWEILNKHVKGENYITHSMAVEAIMKGLAKRLAPDDVEYWGICGLLHDLDEETCPWREDLSTHGPTSVKILKDEGIEDEVLGNAIMSHNPTCGKNPETTLEYAIIAADPMSGFVKASIVLTRGTVGTEELKKEIQNYVKHRTAPYKYPRIVVFREELPKTISGKIQRHLL